ncbi:unnamed protein product [Effrenium voratum]|uniref:Ion transport domain-containing protein n=1 Tax=Effrenium voratum TaxID=2562239 RepID=A0AA36I7I7_9DINO|nr:unnamed protein product [Effrenium voratum]
MAAPSLRHADVVSRCLGRSNGFDPSCCGVALSAEGLTGDSAKARKQPGSPAGVGLAKRDLDAVGLDDSSSDGAHDSLLEEGDDMHGLHHRMMDIQKEKADLEMQLARWKAKADKLDHEIKHLEGKERIIADRLDNHSSQSDAEDDTPPGPECVHFVDGALFNAFSMFIVFINVVIMVGKQYWDPLMKISGALWWVDQAFLVFYIVELGLRFTLWHDQLLLHRPCMKTWPYWLDTIIVLTSIIEQWLLPCFTDVSGTGFGALRIFRIFRFVRILRVCGKASSTADWADNDLFVAFMMGVIFLNCIMMGVQEDFPDWSGWGYCENIFLGIFVFELAIRLAHFGWAFFCNDSMWIFNWLDFIIVVGGVADEWIIPIYNFLASNVGAAEQETTLGTVMNMLRVMRLVRLLRLIRLVRSVPPLYNLLKGILEAMQGMLWLLILTVAAPWL